MRPPRNGGRSASTRGSSSSIICREKYTCVVFDRRECGRSGGRVERVTWDDFALPGQGNARPSRHRTGAPDRRLHGMLRGDGDGGRLAAGRWPAWCSTGRSAAPGTASAASSGSSGTLRMWRSTGWKRWSRWSRATTRALPRIRAAVRGARSSAAMRRSRTPSPARTSSATS